MLCPIDSVEPKKLLNLLDNVEPKKLLKRLLSDWVQYRIAGDA